MSNFTEDSYKEILQIASTRFKFIRFGESLSNNVEYIALWRHDIDFSPQRALALAEIEANFGIISTYYIQLSSQYYSVFDPEVCSIIRQISSLGHDIGLHFDPTIYADSKSVNYEQKIAFESRVLEELTKIPVLSFTVHNPTIVPDVTFDKETYAGLVNGSASRLREQFEYCSDSNGIWRFRSLQDVVEDESVTRIYALTHPEWWQRKYMPPRNRILRCISGRADSSINYYDNLLKFHGRENIR